MLPYHDLDKVVLSVIVGILASYTALDLAGRVTAARGRARIAWLGAGAVALGTGIWAMHFVAMLAFHFRSRLPTMFPWSSDRRWRPSPPRSWPCLSPVVAP